MWTGLWQKRSKFTETNTAIAYEQHGFFEQAQTAYEQVYDMSSQNVWKIAVLKIIIYMHEIEYMIHIMVHVFSKHF